LGDDAAAANFIAVLTTAAGNTLENAAAFNVTATNGSTENADYDSGTFPKTINFPANSGNGATQATTVDSASDALVEGDELVTLTLSVNSGVVTLGAQTAHALTIIDADVATPLRWQNPANPLDVNNNTSTDPLDALIVINELNQNGSHKLPDVTNPPPFFDVNGDDFVTPLDALAVINNLTLPDTPCDPSAVDLIIGGTEGNDVILVVPSPSGGVNVVMNGTTSGPFVPGGRIVICSRGGDDTVTVDPNVNRSTFIYGGAGNDVLEGGSGSDVLVGGSGSDELYGGLGRNVMISGTDGNGPPQPAARKRLLGGLGENLLIAGFTDFDTLDAALRKILDEWGRPDADYATRVNHLRGVLPGGRNEAIFLNNATVHDNAIQDDIFSCMGDNWYLMHDVGATPLDTIFGRKANELLDTL
jgi:hypothetical protein